MSLSRLSSSASKASALPAPLGPALECYEHAAEGRGVKVGVAERGSAIMVRLLAELAMSGM